MTGTRTTGLVIQDRDRRLLRELGTIRVIDREQAKLVAGFGSTTRANTRLLALTRAGLLRRFFVGTIAGGRKAIYTLSPKGASAVDVPFRSIQRPRGETLLPNQFLEHQTGVSSIFVTVKHRPIPNRNVSFRRWISFHSRLSQAAPIIPDGYFELDCPEGVQAMFLEVDRGTEALRRWRGKVQAYLNLAITGEFQRLFGQPRFRVLVVANSERRLKTIRSAVARLTEKIFWFSSFNLIQQDGFWSPVWLRPQGDEKRSLL